MRPAGRVGQVLADATVIVLRGVTDWLSLHPPVRWLGGVRIDPSTPNWRWDEVRQDVRMA